MLNDPCHVFVYPSEIAAEQQRRRLLASRVTVDSRRWISWDQCKQYILENEQNSSQMPANAAVRLLCADRLLASGELKWQELLPDEIVPGVFRRFVARAFPTALRLAELGADRLAAAVGTGMAQDILQLATVYAAFLQQMGMFEPSAVRGTVNTRGAVFHIFDVGVIEDFVELEQQLRGCEGAVIELEQQTAMPVLQWYPDVKAEVRSVIAQVEMLLRNGTACSDIAISAVDHEAVLPFLQREARLRGVQLNVRIGSPLVETPGAGLFSGLAELAGSGMGYTAVRDFVLNRAIPFADQEHMYALAAFGRQWRCWGRFGRDDLWEDAFLRSARIAGEKEGESLPQVQQVQEVYRSLRDAARKMSTASSMQQLRQVFFSWYDRYIDADGWQEATEREFQSCLELLSTLVRMEQQLGFTVSQPFRVLLELMGDQVYMQAGGSGVPVYPYRVAAGGFVPHHFVVNMHQDAVEVLSGGVAFLRDDQLKAAGVEVRDLTEAFLRSYWRCGESVSCSGNAGIGGIVHGVPAVYVNDGEVEYCSAALGSEELERQWWQNPAGTAPALTDAMLQGAAFAEDGLRDGRCNFVTTAFSCMQGKDGVDCALAAVREQLSKRYGGSQGWKVSSNALDQMTNNPAAFFLQRILKLEDQDWEPSWMTAMDVGNVYHQALEILFDPQQPDSTVESVTESMAGWARMQTRLTRLEIEYELRTLRQVLGELLPLIGPQIFSAQVDAIEHSFEVYDDQFQVVWDGRIDRLDRIMADGRMVIWDYKRKSVPVNAAVGPARMDDSDPQPIISKPQMAVYLRWAELSGLETAAVCYVGLLKNAELKKRVSYVRLSEELQQEFGVQKRSVAEAFHEEGFAQLWAALRYQTAEYTRRLRELDFSLDTSRTRFRKNSAFRQVLRHRYNVR